MSKKQAAGFMFAGALAGAAVALLCAPQSGAETKRAMKGFARRTANRLDDLQGDIRSHAADWVGDVAEAVKDGVTRAKQLGVEGYDHVLQAFDGAKKRVEDGRSQVEQLASKV